MTRMLTSSELSAIAASGTERWQNEAIATIFAHAPAWQRAAAMAAVHRIRPELGVVPDDEAHQVHMFRWPRDAEYFDRVCRLFKLFNIGTQW